MIFDDNAVDYHLAIWRWLLGTLGGVERVRELPLLLPTAEFFPARPNTDPAYAEAVLRSLMRHLDMADWPCELEMIVRSTDEHALAKHGLNTEQSFHRPAGTFRQKEDGSAIIQYDESQLADPVSLMATLLHELCHYQMSSVELAPPGGWRMEEVCTDVAVSFFGGGVLVANRAFQFQQHHIDIEGRGGWSWKSQGYLSESQHAYALAVFCVLKGVNPDLPAKHLRPGPKGYFLEAMKDLRHRREWIDELVSTTPESLAEVMAVSNAAEPAAGDAVLSAEELSECHCRSLQKEPLWQFVVQRALQQPEDLSWDERELMALRDLPRSLSLVLHVVRFIVRTEEGGLQNAVLVDTAVPETVSEVTLQNTIEGFEHLRDYSRAAFLKYLLPGIRVHLQTLTEAEAEGTLDEFVSPLDRDDGWQALEPVYLHQLRLIIRDQPATLYYPTSS
ncbi:MAG: hypothetical protein V4662_10775 [Verrucomicrobiota bacterium]